METVLFFLSCCIDFFLLYLPFSIQNRNKDASTDPSFKTYTEPSATPLEHTMDSNTYSEGEGSTCDYAVPDPAVDPAKESTDLFAPLILEDDSQKESVLPQVVITGFTRNKKLNSRKQPSCVMIANTALHINPHIM